MTIKLISLQFQPSGAHGWDSGVLNFGEKITLLLGPNGSGKTPLMRGLAYALGGAIALPPAIKSKCSAISVEFRNHTGGRYHTKRFLSENFHAEAESDGGRVTFSTEKAYSAWLLTAIGIPTRVLSERKSGAPTPPYMSVLLPAFWVDQDTGWSTTYNPPTTHNFIKDQEDEIVRWLIGIPPKNRIIDKAEYQKAKLRLDSINEHIAIKRSALEIIQRGKKDLSAINLDSLEKQRHHLTETLKENQSTFELITRASSAVDTQLETATKARNDARHAVEMFERRLHGMQEISKDISAEIDILGLNETAADAFRSLCGNTSCQFFRKPEDSYGRRLLYLKDQLKDLETSTGIIGRDLEAARRQLHSEESTLANLISQRREAVESVGPHRLISIVDTVSRQIADIELRLAMARELKAEQHKLNDLFSEQFKAEDEVKALRPTGQRRDQGRLLDARAYMQTHITNWLSTVRAQNLQGDIVVDDDLRLVIGGERFNINSSISGSTRTRVVLAYHAALLETSLSMDGVHPPLLVLDTPKQHELDSNDLKAFVEQFRALAKKYSTSLQLVISATEADFVDLTGDDSTWRPRVGPTNAHRYLGSTNNA